MSDESPGDPNNQANEREQHHGIEDAEPGLMFVADWRDRRANPTPSSRVSFKSSAFHTSK